MGTSLETLILNRPCNRYTFVKMRCSIAYLFISWCCFRRIRKQWKESKSIHNFLPHCSLLMSKVQLVLHLILFFVCYLFKCLLWQKVRTENSTLLSFICWISMKCPYWIRIKILLFFSLPRKKQSSYFDTSSMTLFVIFSKCWEINSTFPCQIEKILWNRIKYGHVTASATESIFLCV